VHPCKQRADLADVRNIRKQQVALLITDKKTGQRRFREHSPNSLLGSAESFDSFFVHTVLFRTNTFPLYNRMKFITTVSVRFHMELRRFCYACSIFILFNKNKIVKWNNFCWPIPVHSRLGLEPEAATDPEKQPPRDPEETVCPLYK
jgi:hypothetical protein